MKKCGFIAVLGETNAGKSTLVNRLVGQKVAIVSRKQQTTLTRINGIAVWGDSQIIFVDTPGFLRPRYKLQQTMAACVDRAVGEDADVILLLVDAHEADLPAHQDLFAKIARAFCPVYLVLTKTDLVKDKSILKTLQMQIKELLPNVKKVFEISAMRDQGVTELKESVAATLPESPAYFPPGQWTDRWERFYAAEFIREQIFKLYQQEIPYSTQVEIEKFTEDLGDKNFIRAIIHVERDGQKPILIGKGGAAIAKLRQHAQKRIEQFLGRPYRLELQVVVSPNWRNEEKWLEKFGYLEKEQ